MLKKYNGYCLHNIFYRHLLFCIVMKKALMTTKSVITKN